APPSRAIIGAGSRGSVLPSLHDWMPSMVLPRQGVLPMKRPVLEENHVLPDRHVLPDNTRGSLPWSVLPWLSTGSPKPEAPKEAPENTAPKDDASEEATPLEVPK